mgnify:FL=1
MKVLVTGAAGFIGAAVSERLLARGDEVIGLDSINDYYDPALKHARLERLRDHQRFKFEQLNLADRVNLEAMFSRQAPQRVINLAAQAGVRYSLSNPHAYIDANIVGFLNILEGCRTTDVEHLVYASTSSVYGANSRTPFSTSDSVDHPLSLYAATKKSNELMAHCYSHLHQLPTTGLRFFTVYGPWGRPDMALFLFTKAMLAGEPIKVFNHGHHRRDFTYIDDITEGVVRVLDKPATPRPDWSADAPDPSGSFAPFRVYNIGNSRPVDLSEYIETLEQCLGVTAKKTLLPLQPGDVPDTFANVEDLAQEFDFRPSTSIEEGIQQFVDWYLAYYRPNRVN